MTDDLEARIQDSLDGALDAAATDALAHELEADPAAKADYIDHLRLHHRLGVLFDEEPAAFTDAVLRELRYKGDSERFAKDVVGRIKGGGLRRRWIELVAAGFALVALGFFLLRDHGTTPAADGSELLFVVGQIPLDTGDARVRERLEKTYRVRVRAAKDVRPNDPCALVLISSTVDENLLRTTFRDVAVPLLTWEPRLYHDLGMIAGAVYHQDWGTAPEQTRLLTPNGPFVATSRPAPYSWAKVRGDATTIATLENDPTRAVIFRYEQGAAMPGLRAPARRAGMFLFDWTAMALTDDGWR
ncbi:MAG: hypothetical protein JO332_18760, partial [Planctomycetaceae bacterium]|nr:hypothetical protein [Planctomycetaceae bacterium]